MIRTVRSLVPLPLFATGVLGVVLLASPGRRELALHVYLLVLAALALGRLVLELRRAHPRADASPFDLGLAERPAAEPPLPELARLEREVTLSGTTAFDLHFRLRPVLRRIARRLLAARRGIDLDRNPAAAERALGHEAWELVRPDREPPADRSGPGLELAVLGRVVTSLEQL